VTRAIIRCLDVDQSSAVKVVELLIAQSLAVHEIVRDLAALGLPQGLWQERRRCRHCVLVICVCDRKPARDFAHLDADPAAASEMLAYAGKRDVTLLPLRINAALCLRVGPDQLPVLACEVFEDIRINPGGVS
jgi:hypothetical protein